MAQKTIVELLDDIDGKPAAESINFALDGVSYEIDLSTTHAEKLRKGLEPFVEKARRPKSTVARAGRKSAGAGARTTTTRERSTDIRSWAKEHGIAVNQRGRIPAKVVEAYEANDPGRAS